MRFRFALLILMLGCQQTLRAETEAALTLTSNYVNRGITQSSSAPALQAGLRENFDNGLYQGVWASSLKLNDGGGFRVEGNYFLGYLHHWEGWRWDGGLAVLAYPTKSRFDRYSAVKVYGDLRYDVGTQAFGVYSDYVNNYFESGTASYWEGYGLFRLSDGFEAGLHWGSQTFTDRLVVGVPSYTYNKVTLTKDMGEWNAAFAYHVSGLLGPACFGGQRWCGEMATFSVTRRFSM